MKKTVLIIEENLEMQENLAEILNLADYNVVTAGDELTGWNLIHSLHPDLVIYDVAANEEIQSGSFRFESDENPGPFLFLNTSSGDKIVNNGLQPSLADYLLKPFKGEELLFAVSRLIGDPYRVPRPSQS